MIIISVDPGTYSLKYVVTEHQKKSIKLLDAGEVILAQHVSAQDNDLHKLHAKIIEEIKTSFPTHSKVSLVLPAHLTTSRFITLPIKNKKKAEMMIPFQLDEELPYSSSELHFAAKLTTEGNQTNAIVSITKKDEFESFLDPLLDRKIELSYLTNQLSLFADITSQQQFDSRFCILDFGHETTKAYFFKDGSLISQHISYIAGKTLTEAISKSYKIDFEEAVKYKHDNAFVLTDDQLEEVNDSQRKFASLMDEVLFSLVNDFKRWDLGYRVNQSEPIQQVYLTGGSAHIKNIESYLLNKLNYPIAHLSQEIISPIDLSGATDKYLTCTLLADSYTRRNKISSFLTGEYSSQSSEDLPLHSISFLGLRVALICLFLITSIFVERFFISKHLKTYSKKVSNILKNPALELSSADKRKLKKQPEKILAKLRTKQNDMANQKRALQSMQSIDTFSPLIKLSNFAKQKGVALDQFTCNEQNEIIAVFVKIEESTAQSLSLFKSIIERESWPELKTTLNRDTTKLTVRYYGGF